MNKFWVETAPAKPSTPSTTRMMSHRTKITSPGLQEGDLKPKIIWMPPYRMPTKGRMTARARRTTTQVVFSRSRLADQCAAQQKESGTYILTAGQDTDAEFL